MLRFSSTGHSTSVSGLATLSAQKSGVALFIVIAAGEACYGDGGTPDRVSNPGSRVSPIGRLTGSIVSWASPFGETRW
jgi:hypothetical protein